MTKNLWVHTAHLSKNPKLLATELRQFQNIFSNPTTTPREKKAQRAHLNVQTLQVF